jgi:hypothetical protein
MPSLEMNSNDSNPLSNVTGSVTLVYPVELYIIKYLGY